MVYYAWQRKSGLYRYTKIPQGSDLGDFLFPYYEQGLALRLIAVASLIEPFTMKPQEVKPKAQTDWLGFCKGVRTYVQHASLMKLSWETGTKAIIPLRMAAEHMS